MDTLRCSCAMVRKPSELRFGLMRGVDRAIAALDVGPKVHVVQLQRHVREIVLHLFADFTARCIFRIQQPCASASLRLSAR